MFTQREAYSLFIVGLTHPYLLSLFFIELRVPLRYVHALHEMKDEANREWYGCPLFLTSPRCMCSHVLTIIDIRTSEPIKCTRTFYAIAVSLISGVSRGFKYNRALIRVQVLRFIAQLHRHSTKCPQAIMITCLQKRVSRTLC